MPEHLLKDWTKLRQLDVAAVFGVTEKTVREWTREGGCPRNLDRTYNLTKVIQWYANRAGGGSASPELTPEERADPVFMAAYLSGNATAKEKLLHYKAERERLAFEREKGDLVPREQVRELFGALGHRLRQAGEVLRRKFGPAAYGVLDDVLSSKEWRRYGREGGE